MRDAKVGWGKRPSTKAPAAHMPPGAAALENFVNPEKSRATKRLNAEIPAALHARMKAQCALAGKDMTERIIEILAREFPEK